MSFQLFHEVTESGIEYTATQVNVRVSQFTFICLFVLQVNDLDDLFYLQNFSLFVSVYFIHVCKSDCVNLVNVFHKYFSCSSICVYVCGKCVWTWILFSSSSSSSFFCFIFLVCGWKQQLSLKLRSRDNSHLTIISLFNISFIHDSSSFFFSFCKSSTSFKFYESENSFVYIFFFQLKDWIKL